MKKVLKPVLFILSAVIILACIFVIYLTVTEYRPSAVEELSVSSAPDSITLTAGQELCIMSWNIGYGGLGKDSDFFMDGGENVQAADEDTVKLYLDGISEHISSKAPDILMLQEVDINSKRSYGIDQSALLTSGNFAHALNYSCDFVPFPMPPIGKVNSGILTDTAFAVSRAERIALPCPFSWPVSTANLKRCLLVEYLPIEGSDSCLVLVNLHLEAYDSGEGKIAQTALLRDFIESEYLKGNYVIAGGDFNQSFPGSLEKYPNMHADLWTPGKLDDSFLPDGFVYAYDASSPTCRLLNTPYDPSNKENTQHYVIDGFILSPNVTLNSVETESLGFEYSDHNPVCINVTLSK